MTHSLYFISLIADALAEQEPEKRLKEALNRINDLGKQAGYKEGFHQFRLFMHEVIRESEKPVHQLKLIDEEPFEIQTKEAAAHRLEANLLKEKDVIGNIQLHNLPAVMDFPSIDPGSYILRLSTGRIVWKAELTEQDLLWPEAFPDEYLELAADTYDAISRKSKEYHILDGQIAIGIYPGLENGMIRITVSG